jgi:hypothetical protein
VLKITIPSVLLFNEANQTFKESKAVTLQLEHSLVSISKWESVWRKPFLTKEKKTRAETLDYIKAMTITQNIDPSVYNNMPQSVIDRIVEYIETPRTATFVPENKGKISREPITSELIYYWMITFNVPFECQTWHLDRLLTLIKVINLKSQPKKKGATRDLMSRNAALNAKRKAELKTTG